MKVMILAAGRGARLAPLTDSTPKPLIKVAGKALIDHQIERLYRAGFREFVVNLGYRGEQLRAHLDATYRHPLVIEYSREPEDAYETGGGIKHALPLLGDEPFLVTNADIWTEFDYASLAQTPAGLAHLVLVPNPPHNPTGDFSLDGETVRPKASATYTFAGISVINPSLFKELNKIRFPLAPLLVDAANRGAVSGVVYSGPWFDVGTAQRLTEIYEYIASHNP